MPDSASLAIGEEQRMKAINELEEAKVKFPGVCIDITDSEIIFTGNIYDDVMKCKYHFEVKLGLKRVIRRGERSRDEDDDAPVTKSFVRTEYVTYEKINVIVVEANFVEFDGEIDCFVNTTNNKLEALSMVSKTIKDKGGLPYVDMCDAVKHKALTLKTTECISTKAGNMNTPNIIHAICPNQTDYVFNFSNKALENDVFSTVFNCLKMAEELGIHSIAFPFLSTGHGQLDIKICSEQYAYAILEFSRLRENQFVVETIYFIDIDKDKVDIANKVFEQIIPTSSLDLLEIPREGHKIVSDVPESTDENVDIDHEQEDLNDLVDGKRPDYSECTAVDVGPASPVENHDYENIQCIHPEEIESKVYEGMPEFRKNIGNYTLIIEKSDIRNTKMVAIVCPENEGMERGGLLAASIKCRFRHSFNDRKLGKIQKNAIATTEYTTEDGGMQYILHIMLPIWKEGIDEKQLEKALKGAVVMIFDKLVRHKKRQISSIAIPLFGIGRVENDDVISKCCKWQIEQVVDILKRKKEIPNLKEVCLVNRCEKIRNTLITHVQVSLAHQLTSTT